MTDDELFTIALRAHDVAGYIPPKSRAEYMREYRANNPTYRERERERRRRARSSPLTPE